METHEEKETKMSAGDMDYCKFHSFMGKESEARECKDCRLKYNKCKKCGKEYGLHPNDDHDFEGVPYKADCIYKNEDCKICPRLNEEIEHLKKRMYCDSCKKPLGFFCDKCSEDLSN